MKNKNDEKKGKNIFIEYVTIDNEIYEKNKMRIARNYPKYDKFKDVYLYELFQFDFLEDKIRNLLQQNILKDYQFYDSFLIKLTDKEIIMIEDLFSHESDLEKENWENDYSMVNLAISALKCDPKFWEV